MFLLVSSQLEVKLLLNAVGVLVLVDNNVLEYPPRGLGFTQQLEGGLLQQRQVHLPGQPLQVTGVEVPEKGHLRT